MSNSTFVRKASSFFRDLLDRTKAQEAWHTVQDGWTVFKEGISPRKRRHEQSREFPSAPQTEPSSKRRRLSSPFTGSTPLRLGSRELRQETPLFHRGSQGLRSALKTDSRRPRTDVRRVKMATSHFGALSSNERLDVGAVFQYPVVRKRRESSAALQRAQPVLKPAVTREMKERYEGRPAERRVSIPISTGRVVRPESRKRIMARPLSSKGVERKILSQKRPPLKRVPPRLTPRVAEKRVAPLRTEEPSKALEPVKGDRKANGTVEIVKEKRVEVEEVVGGINSAKVEELDRQRLLDILPDDFVDLIEGNPLFRAKVVKLHGPKMVAAWQAEMRRRERGSRIRAAEEEGLRIRAKKEAERLRMKDRAHAPEEPSGNHFDTVYWDGSDDWVEEDDIQARMERSKGVTVTKEGSAFAPLTESAMKRLRATLWERQYDPSDLINVNGCIITGEDLGRLRPHVWLNDEIVNAYLELVAMRNGRERENGKKLPKIRIMNSFFYSKLVSFNSAKGGKVYDYSRVRRWTRRFDVFSYDIMLIPINQENTHWTLGIVNFRDKQVQHLDSMGMGGSMKVRENLLAWVKDEAADKKKPFVQGEWTMPLKDVPKQGNSDDCGVFLCKFADFLARGWDEFTFDQRHMNYFRSRIAHELLMKRAS